MATLNGNGLEETITAHSEGGELIIAIVGDEEGGYAKAQQTVAFIDPIQEVVVAAGDFDGDARAEIAVVYATAFGAGLVVFEGEPGSFVPIHNQALEANLVGSDLFFSLEAGNIDNDLHDELAIVINEFTPAMSTSSHLVLDDAESNWFVLRSGPVESLATWTPSVPCIVADVSLGDIDGDGIKELLFAGLDRFDDTCGIAFMNLMAYDDAAHEFEEMGGRQEYTEYGPCGDHVQRMRTVHINSGDLDGDGNEEVQVGHRIYDDWASTAPWISRWSMPQDVVMDYASDYQDYARSTSTMVMGDFTGNGKCNVATFRLNESQVRIFGLEDPGSDPDLILAKTLVLRETNSEQHTYPLLVPVNSDKDSPVLSYDEGEYEFIFTEPIVIAVLAAPPYQLEVPQNLAQSMTSFGNTTSNGTEEERGATLSTSGSVGASFNGGLTQTSLELKATVSAAVTELNGSAYELSKTVIFSSAHNEDKVVLTTIPMDVYTYTILSHADPEMVGEKLTVRLPRKMITLQVERNYYNEHIVDGGSVIDESVFRHTLGDPWSYPTAGEKNATLATVGGLESDLETVGIGSSFVTSVVAVSNSWSEGGTLEAGFEISVQGTKGGLLGGFTVGGSLSSTLRTTSGEQTTYTGFVGDIDEDFYDSSLGYSFGVFTYLHTDPVSGRQFEVVNYWVE